MDMMLSLITWAAPQWALALPLVAVPLLLHLWSRRTGPRLRFPSVRLIDAAHRRIHRFSPARRWLLLIIRCGCVVVLIAVFAQPRWQNDDNDAVPGATADGGESYSPTESANEQPSHHVIIIDNSASMNRTRAGRTLLQHAMETAVRVIDRIAARNADAVFTIVAATPRPRSIAPSPARSAAVAHAAIDRIKSTEASADLAAALPLAPTDARIQLFTDAQPAAVDGLVNLRSEVHQRITVHRITASKSSQINLALHRARVEPMLLVPAQSATLRCSIENHSEVDLATGITIETMNNRMSRIVEMSSHSATEISQPLQFDQPGLQTVELSIDRKDALPSDDRQHAAVYVWGEDDLVLLTDHNVNDRDGLAFYLRRAVSPFAESAETPRVVDVEQLDAMPATPRVVLVVLQKRPSPKLLNTIESLMQSGTGILWLAASTDALIDLHTGKPLPRDDVDTSSMVYDTMHFTAAGPQWAAVFDGNSIDALHQCRFLRARTPPLPDSSAALALAAWSDGTPAILLRAGSPGPFITITAPIGPHSTAFSRSAAFVPVIHEMMREVFDPAAFIRHVNVGKRGTAEMPTSIDPLSLKLVGPGTTPADFVIRRTAATTRLITEPIKASGAWRILDSTGRSIAGILAHIDERESDMSVTSLSHLNVSSDEHAAKSDITFDASSKPATPVRPAALRPLWPLLVMLLGLLLVADAVLTESRRSSA
jgi:hypothetical protein